LQNITVEIMWNYKGSGYQGTAAFKYFFTSKKYAIEALGKCQPGQISYSIGKQDVLEVIKCVHI